MAHNTMVEKSEFVADSTFQKIFLVILLEKTAIIFAKKWKIAGF